ncbi:MAG: ribose 5-phosphate isomerase B [Ruminococcaceae bacterium]|nr:ribose 5-phosphate isomerase B [Oscillospiraceae bacterium]
MENKKIVIASDHAGYDLKEKIKKYLAENGYEVTDCGTNSTDSCDYPEFANKLCLAIKDDPEMKGILICGTGIGMSMAANRHSHIRAALCHNEFTARLTRQHNNANVLCMGARTIGEELAFETMKVFLDTEFMGGKHERRINMF